jgi:predicted transposase YdaD
VDGPVQAIDSEVSTVLAEVDKVLRVQSPSPWLAHLEFQSGHDRTLPIRLLQYHGLLLRRHELPVESAVVLLRPQADGPELSGRFEQRGPSGRQTIVFQFQVIRVWERPVEEFLAGSLALLPLAPLARFEPATLTDIVERMDARLTREAPPEIVPELWASTLILMGLRYHADVGRHVLRRVRQMRESTTYQAILEEGREEGEARGLARGLERGMERGLERGLEYGRAQEARRLILLFGEARLGPPDAAVRARLDALTDADRLDQLAERLLSVTSWPELLADADEATV